MLPAARKGSKQAARIEARQAMAVIRAEVVLKASPPEGSRFLGYEEDILVQDLRIVVETVRYRRERWVGPGGERISMAALPAGILGGYGPELRRFIAAGHFQGQVTTERLTALLTGMGMAISKRQVVRLLSKGLEDLIAEDQAVLRAGLETAPWITVDDTGHRHAGQDGFVTQIGDDRFAVFRSSPCKSRQAFLEVLRAGHEDFVINDAALEYMRGRKLAGPLIAALADHPTKHFADEAAWQAHLQALGAPWTQIEPDPVAVATEGRCGARSRPMGCWPTPSWSPTARPVPAPRSRPLLGPRRAADPQAHPRQPSPPQSGGTGPDPDLVVLQGPQSLQARPRSQAGQGPARPLQPHLPARPRLHSSRPPPDRGGCTCEKLEYSCASSIGPAIPLHTNGSENDIRSWVTKRKISGGTVSVAEQKPPATPCSACSRPAPNSTSASTASLDTASTAFPARRTFQACHTCCQTRSRLWRPARGFCLPLTMYLPSPKPVDMQRSKAGPRPPALRQRLNRFHAGGVRPHTGSECPPTAPLSEAARRCRSTPAGHPPAGHPAACSAARAGSPTTQSPSDQSAPLQPPLQSAGCQIGQRPIRESHLWVHDLEQTRARWNHLARDDLLQNQTYRALPDPRTSSHFGGKHSR